MAEPIDRIESALVGALRAVPGLATVHDAEVPQLGKLPAATLLFSFVEQEDGVLGPVTENGWRWILRFYFDAKGERYGQKHMKQVLPAALKALRDEPTLGGACDRLAIRDGGPPTFNREGGILMKALEVTAETEEE